MTIRNFLLCIPAALLTLCSCRTVPENPILQTGRIMFWGDELTAGQLYPGCLEAFYRTRFPQGEAVFLERGWKGDRPDNLLRMKRDGIPEKADLIYLMYRPAGLPPEDADLAGSLKQFSSRLRETIRLFREANPGCRFVLMPAPVPASADAPSRWAARCQAEEMKALAREPGITFVDQNFLYQGTAAGYAELFSGEKLIREDGPSPLQPLPLSADNLPLSRAAQSILAVNLLPPSGDLSVITLDAAAGTLTARGSNLTPLGFSPDRTSFNFRRQLQRLPFALPEDISCMEALLGIHERFNRDLLIAANLKPGIWRLSIDGETYRNFTSGELAEGINLSEFNHNPDMLQARKVMRFIEIKNSEDRKFWLARLKDDNGLIPDPGKKCGSIQDLIYQRKLCEINGRNAAIKFHSGAYYHEISLVYLPDGTSQPWRTRFQKQITAKIKSVRTNPEKSDRTIQITVLLTNPTDDLQKTECYLEEKETLRFLGQADLKAGESKSLELSFLPDTQSDQYSLRIFYQPGNKNFPRQTMPRLRCAAP